MNATVEDLGDVTIISLFGFLDFESVVPFRNYCLTQLVNKRVIFDMKGLNFVGSSGITAFLDTMRDYRGMAPAQPRFCGVGTEFKRLFATAHLAGLELFESPNAAIYGTSAEIIPQWIEAIIEDSEPVLEKQDEINPADLLMEDAGDENPIDEEVIGSDSPESNDGISLSLAPDVSSNQSLK